MRPVPHGGNATALRRTRMCIALLAFFGTTIGCAAHAQSPVAPDEQISAPAATESSEAAAPQPEVALRRLAFSVSVLFAQDTADRTPQATAILDQVSLQLSDAVDGAILLTGHSDPVESSAGRDDLSQARALAVANYLAKAGIPADHIEVRSGGSATPATDAADCRDQEGLELAACLAPDRAVDVEVVAIKVEAADQDNAANPDAMTPAAN